MTAVKICGLSEPDTLKAAITAGARFVGFVFYPPSPRYVNFEIAYELARQVPTGVRSVGLFVDPSNEELHHITSSIQLDMIQLHGDETPGRVAEVKVKTNMPVMKAIRVASDEDLEGIDGFEAAADWLLFDSRPPKAALPGGTGESFDWSILKDRKFKKPWMLGGGLNEGNIKDALSILKPTAVDVSSGVESSRGVKDADKIKSFIQRVKEA